jgi:hypothetical protein
MAPCCKSLVTEGLILITNFMTDLMSCMHAIVCRIYRIYGLGFMVHGLELRLYVLGLRVCVGFMLLLCICNSHSSVCVISVCIHTLLCLFILF